MMGSLPSIHGIARGTGGAVAPEIANVLPPAQYAAGRAAGRPP